MSLWRIAWRSLEQRGLASILTTLSMALGVMMVVAVLSISGVIAESFRSNASLGYNMVVGAKGGKLQLTLNTVYYLSQVVENLPYDFYLEFLPQSRRVEEWQNSLQYQAASAQAMCGAISGLTVPDGLARVGAVVSFPAVCEVLASPLEMHRDGKYSQFTGLAIPVCLGDYYGPFRVVGTTPDFFDQLTFGPENDRKYEFAAGRNFQLNHPEHSHFEAVVGAQVAAEMDVQLGDTFATTHGDPEGAGHGQRFTVVGILRPSGTPNDRAAFVNMEGFFLMEDHAKPLAENEDTAAGGPQTGGQSTYDAADPAESAGPPRRRLPLEQREVTSILLRTVHPLVARGLKNSINEGPVGQAVFPIDEIYGLFDTIVRPLQMLLLALTGLICAVSGVSILVSIYNSMNDRRHEIAVMRALGANRGTVMTIILLESILLSLGGGALGWLAGHALNWLASSRIASQTGVSLGFWDVAPPLRDLELWGLERIMSLVSPEIMIVPLLISLAVVVGLLPAVAAYRTDVAKSLQDS